jgi:hypothetical protein
MNDIEKLRALLPHWLEHNQEHAREFEAWAAKASLARQEAAAQQIRYAAKAMEQANDALQTALAELGGPVHLEHHSHTH